MALLWMDAFDLGTTTATNGRYESNYGTGTATSVAARTNNGIRFSNGDGLEKQLGANYTDLVIGFAFKPGSAAQNTFLLVRDGTTTQVQLRVNADLTISILNGSGAVLATTSALQVLSTSAFIYLELKVNIHNTTGSYELRANETTWLSATGVNTRNSVNNYANRVGIVGATGAATHTFDDFYIADLTAPMPAGDFYGNLKIERLAPSGAGTTTQWTPSAGSNYQNVDENAHNSDTDYNASATVGNIDTYAMADMAASSGSIRAVQTTLVARKDDALARQIAPVMRSGGTDYVGATKTLTTSYAYYYQQYDQDPATSADWDFTGVNAVEVGVKVIT